MIGLNLAGATWLAIHMAVVEHDAAAGITIAILSVAIVVGNLRATATATSCSPRTSARPRAAPPIASTPRAPSSAPPVR